MPIAQPVRVIKSKSPIGSWQPDAHTRSDIHLKWLPGCTIESIRCVRGVCENGNPKAWNLPPSEPALQFTRR
jgi:hypothetical protein